MYQTHFSQHAAPIVALFLVLTLAAGMFSCLLFEQEHLQRIGRGFYSDRAVFFRFMEEAGQEGLRHQNVLAVADATDYLVMNSVEDVRGVFVKGTPDIPPMLSGRFLNENDCASDSQYAVVGRDRWSEVQTENGLQVIRILGKSYEVIGQMGTSYPSTINDLVMVNLFSLAPELQISGRLLVDGGNTESVFDGIKKNMAAQHMPAPERMNVPADAVQALMGFGGGEFNNRLRTSYLMALIAIMLLSSAILLAEWIRRQTRTIAVLRLVGYSGRAICAAILREFLMLTLFGIVLAVGIMMILIHMHLFQTNTGMIRQGLWTGGFSLAAGLCVTVPALLHAVRVDVVKILR